MLLAHTYINEIIILFAGWILITKSSWLLCIVLERKLTGEIVILFSGVAVLPLHVTIQQKSYRELRGQIMLK